MTDDAAAGEFREAVKHLDAARTHLAEAVKAATPPAPAPVRKKGLAGLFGRTEKPGPAPLDERLELLRLLALEVDDVHRRAAGALAVGP